MLNSEQSRWLRHNYIFNVLDSGFFGLGLGISSYATVLPLFMATLTDSTVLIGLIATIHTLGWQLPQLLTSGRVARVKLFRPTVLMMTLNERIPILLIGAVALAIPSIPKSLALALTFLLLCWESIGGGLTATAWQSMIAKILPPSIRGTFYGVQSGWSNFLGSLGAFLAGSLLVLLPYPSNFAVCFGLTFVAKMISWILLAQTQEIEHEPIPTQALTWRDYLRKLRDLLRNDPNFAWFIMGRAMMSFGQMAMAFYVVYGLRVFKMDGQTAGVLTGVMLLAQMASNPIVGYLGDRFGHRLMLAIGSAVMALSAIVALMATDLSWFYVVFILAGIVNGTNWTSILAFSSEFGTESSRPYYVGLSNTLIAPATLLAPILGGLMVDSVGFNAMFLLSILGSILSTLLMIYWVQNPDPTVSKKVVSVVTSGD